jgi:hypothetical protein
VEKPERVRERYTRKNSAQIGEQEGLKQEERKETG